MSDAERHAAAPPFDAGAPLPALRPIDVLAFRDANHGLQFAMRDLTGIAPRPIAISLAGYFIVSQLDGRRTCRDIQASFQTEFGSGIETAQIMRVVEALDHVWLLSSPRFETEYQRRRSEYAETDVRDRRSHWPGAAALTAEIAREIRGGTAAEAAVLRGVIAPHLDYHRGGPCYADAYATLRRAGPKPRYVILGTNHFGHAACVTATTKDFLTPLGRAATDRAFIAAIESRLGASMCENEFDHLAEHSVELHVHLLQAVFPGAAFQIVPIMTPDPCGPSGTRPADGRGPDLNDFADALGDLLAGGSDTVVIVSADWSHVGQRFGERERTTPEFMAGVERHDRRLLAFLESGDAEGFLAAARADQNATRICSVGNLYAARRALRGAAFVVQRYHQATDFPNETHVTCAAAAFGDASPRSTAPPGA